MDFGYNDPTAIVAVYEDERGDRRGGGDGVVERDSGSRGGGYGAPAEDNARGGAKPALWLKLCLYETHLTSAEIAERAKELNAMKPALFVCDNARPEMIRDLVNAGLSAVPCDKSPSGKINGKRYNINLVQEREIHYLRGDKELEREYLTYAWRKQKSSGKTLDQPEDGNDHALDALAYAVRDMSRKAVEWAEPRWGY